MNVLCFLNNWRGKFKNGSYLERYLSFHVTQMTETILILLLHPYKYNCHIFTSWWTGIDMVASDPSNPIMPQSSSHSVHSWDFLWSFVMQCSASRSWLFQSEPPSKNQLVHSLTQNLFLMKYHFEKHGGQSSTGSSENFYIHSMYSSYEDTVLGFNLGLGKDDPMAVVIGQCPGSITPARAINENVIRRSVWKRFHEHDIDCIINMEFSWDPSGCLAVRITLTHTDIHSKLNSINYPFFGFSEIRLFSPINASSLLRTSEEIDTVVNLRSSSGNVAPYTLSTFFNHPPSEDIFMISATVKHSTKDFKGLNRKYVTQNTSSYWNRLVNDLPEIDEAGQLDISTVKKTSEETGSPPLLQQRQKLMYTISTSSDLSIEGQYENICDVYGIGGFSPYGDNVLKGMNGIFEVSDEQISMDFFFRESWGNKMKSDQSPSKICNVNGTNNEIHDLPSVDLCSRNGKGFTYLETNYSEMNRATTENQRHEKINITNWTPKHKSNRLVLPHGTKSVWECNECGKIIKGKRSNLVRHIANIHRKSFPFICEEPTCNRRFQSNNNLQRHVLSVHDGRKYLCVKCTRKFKTVESLQGHYESAHKNQICTLRCKHCGGCYSRQSVLRRHEHDHHGLTQK